ncbi:hypothetical protein CFC21_043241 [Triticum aestivum]|uniref:DUF6598 domain-containing protein n=3 Tax=Triticum TaxID=4564 RepID=A0A9R1S7B0_TRITD|nr:uncharacterized protein LOC123071727 [Triticum aestivum]KAF7032011.1 hypothetical protein CFC21_043241 [Triticum aestivum]VAH82854.1 unnamed protein product [Triticum turgidum subsp. durum]
MGTGGAQEVTSSMALRSGMTLCDDNPLEEKGRGMGSGGAQAVSSSMTLRRRSRDDPNEEKRSGVERGGAQAVVSSTAPRSIVALGADGRPLDGVVRAELLWKLKHGDGSIYRSDGYWAKVYRLYDTSETCLEPMMMTVPYDSCMPNWRVCGRHSYCAMMQIFSLKLANTSYVGDPVELYGYVAVRDLLNPMRNYVFNRTRDDPFIVGHDGLIQMSGPKRGIRMEATVLIEFDLKIKTGGEECGDLELIDGVAQFSDRGTGHARVITRRLDGDCGSVDITFALLEQASEATIQVGISEIQQDSCLSLCLVGSYTSPSYAARGKIQLFDGVIAAETSELTRAVVAVAQDAKLVVTLKLSQKGGPDIYRCDVFRVEKHGTQSRPFYFGLAKVEVMVTWSTMDIPYNLLGPNCFRYEFQASDGIEFDD